MTLSSKPQDNDALVELQLDPIGGRRLVGTHVLLRFFDDLVALFNSDTIELSEVLALVQSIESKNSGQIEDLRRSISCIPVDQQRSMVPIIRKIDALNQTLYQQLNRTLVLAQAIQKRQSDTERQVNNLEHVCLSNLVRQRG